MAYASDGPRSVAEAASLFVLSRQPSGLVSVADGIVVVRQLVPWCRRTDEELAELVATIAIQQGRNVAFDVPRPSANWSILPAMGSATEQMLH